MGVEESLLHAMVLWSVRVTIDMPRFRAMSRSLSGSVKLQSILSSGEPIGRGANFPANPEELFKDILVCVGRSVGNGRLQKCRQFLYCLSVLIGTVTGCFVGFASLSTGQPPGGQSLSVSEGNNFQKGFLLHRFHEGFTITGVGYHGLF